MRKAPNPKFFMLLTGVAIIGGIALCMFQYSSLQNTKEAVAKLKHDALDQTSLEMQLKDSESKLQQCSAQLNHLEKGVPELDYVPTMLKELESIGKENGLDVLGVKPVPPPAKDPNHPKPEDKKQYTALDIEVTCRGDYSAVRRFARALQSFPKIVAARTISMTPKQDLKVANAGPPNLDITIDLRSYLFPPDRSEMKQARALGATPTAEGSNYAG